MAKRRPTELDAILEQATRDALTARLRLTAESWGDEIAKEILADDEFRAALKALVRHAAQDIMQRLTAAPRT